MPQNEKPYRYIVLKNNLIILKTYLRTFWDSLNFINTIVIKTANKQRMNKIFV